MPGGEFLSTTIPYVNARPHLGHAFEFVQADAYVRYLRARGGDVFFTTGSDENSLKNVLAAEKEGVTARALVDRNVAYFEELTEALGMSVDAFVRTSVDRLHLDGARRFWELLDQRGDIFKRVYGGLYCVGCEEFYTPDELVDGKCPEHDVPPEYVEESNYFFRLSRYQDELERVIADGTLRIWPDGRRAEALNFVRRGLADISISRSVQRARGWGIPVPGDDGQVMYVWIDALTNYVNALGWVDGAPGYERYWDDASRRIHVVGKGVIRFHAVYWPAMLLSAGLPLPTDIVVHGYITVSGRKLSKSAGNVVDPADLLERFGADTVRHYLLGELSPFVDGDFSEERLVAWHNSELANNLGNLLNRVLSMVARYRDGRVPVGGAGAGDIEADLLDGVDEAAATWVEGFDGFDHRTAVQALNGLSRRVNAYLGERRPWQLAKEAAAGDAAAEAGLDATLHHAAAALAVIGQRLAPVVPTAAAQITDALGIEPLPLLDAAGALARVAGAECPAQMQLFPRLEVAAAES